MAQKIETEADASIKECLRANRSFALIAGAGSGKTSSLVDALAEIRNASGKRLRQNGQRVACITYTERATEVISGRLGFDELYLVSTLHGFLWGEIKNFQFDIKEAIRNDRIPKLIAKAREDDNGGNSKQARRARERVADLEAQLGALDTVDSFHYEDSPYGVYSEGVLGHDDIIEIATHLLGSNETFRSIIGFRFPYIFVDEAQDTFSGIVDGLNAVCAAEGLPIVGYFGDPWQQIYEKRAGDFDPPVGGEKITKTENFRCSESVIRLLNAFRDDVVQYAAGDNRGREGTVRIRLIESEQPLGPRNRLSEDQMLRCAERMDTALGDCGWAGREDVIRLFLVRQMIARRLGFASLNQLFTGSYASAKAQEKYESGEHFLLKPFVDLICPLLSANQFGDEGAIIDLLRRYSPAFDTKGKNSERPLGEMIDLSREIVTQLSEAWAGGSVKEILGAARAAQIFKFSERLSRHLDREARVEEYDEEVYGADREDWLCDAFFGMTAVELPNYAKFISANTPYSTQHGVKGEEYPNVLVVMDDLEAGWNNYSFTKLLTPGTAGAPTEGQRERGRKLAYVCFSRARENLGLILYTPNPRDAARELVARGLLAEDQIEVVMLA